MLLKSYLQKPFSSHRRQTLVGTTLASRTTMRNIEVLFEPNLFFISHIKQVSRAGFFPCYSIAKIVNVLSQRDAEKLNHSWATSRMDNCNFLSWGNITLKSFFLIWSFIITHYHLRFKNKVNKCCSIPINKIDFKGFLIPGVFSI